MLRLSGQARASARTMSAQEVRDGGIMRGKRLDLVSYLLSGLAMRYAQLGDETRLAAMNEMLAFRRNSGENIN